MGKIANAAVLVEENEADVERFEILVADIINNEGINGLDLADAKIAFKLGFIQVEDFEAFKYKEKPNFDKDVDAIIEKNKNNSAEPDITIMNY